MTELKRRPGVIPCFTHMEIATLGGSWTIQKPWWLPLFIWKSCIVIYKERDRNGHQNII